MNDHECDKGYEEGVKMKQEDKTRSGWIRGKSLSGDDTGQLNSKPEQNCFPDRRSLICKNPERKDKACTTGKEEQNVR